MNIAFPFHFDNRGHTAQPPNRETHIVELIEQLLFTRKGERVNRPDFGCGLMHLVFEPNKSELDAVALEQSVRAELLFHIGDAINLHNLLVSPDDATIGVHVEYSVRSTGEVHKKSFKRSRS
jgi:hypothetical protein